jgi:hypothetical protein
MNGMESAIRLRRMALDADTNHKGATVERPPEPRPEREEIVERHVVTESHSVSTPRERGGIWALWLIPLLVLVIVLVWYALTRGQPQSVTMPEVDVPAAEPSRTEQRIEIDVVQPREAATPPADADAPPPEGS